MHPGSFVALRQARWQRFESLLTAAARDISRLSGDDLLELGRLYRAVSADLALAQRDFPGDRVTTYLNSLLARAHPVIYRERTSTLAGIAAYFRTGFPAAYRAAAPYTLVSFLLVAAPALIAAILVAWRPSMADVLLPGTAQSLRAVLAQHHLWVGAATSNHSVAANFIMVNNIKVAFFAFAGGLLVGLGTVWVLVQNGIMLGGVAALVAQYGLSRPFWAFVVPHGVVELSVIFMAGGAGLMMGDAILRPGLLRRRDALPLAARRAAYLIVAAVPLLIVAGTIEGFFSASPAPDVLKYAVGGITGILLYGYVLFSPPNSSASGARVPITSTKELPVWTA